MSDFKVVTVRMPLNMVEEVQGFSAEIDVSESEALRNLIGLGLEASKRINLNELRLVSANAKAAAITRFYSYMQDAIDQFRTEEFE